MRLRIKFLGSGRFAKPIKEVLGKRFALVNENPDIQVVANYGRILTEREISGPKYATLNIHPSCLPKYRGASPLQYALLNGESTTCVCIIKMARKVDSGPILACEEIPIEADDNLSSLTDKAAQLAAKMLPYLLIGYISGSISPQQQSSAEKTAAKKLLKQDGLLDLAEPIENLERKIRAFYGWPGAYIKLDNNKLLKIHRAHTDRGKLVLDEVQLEGKQRMQAKDFGKGFRGKLPKPLTF